MDRLGLVEPQQGQEQVLRQVQGRLGSTLAQVQRQRPG
jgi:hypothetical protein